mgnify:CR=1 FL=1
MFIFKIYGSGTNRPHPADLASLVYWRYYCLFPDKLDLPRTDLETEDSQLFYQFGIIRIFFLSNVPQAYDGFIWILLLFTGFTFILPWLSVTRFKAGKQD